MGISCLVLQVGAREATDLEEFKIGRGPPRYDGGTTASRRLRILQSDLLAIPELLKAQCHFDMATPAWMVGCRKVVGSIGVGIEFLALAERRSGDAYDDEEFITISGHIK